MRWQSTTWIIGTLVVVLAFSNMASARPREKTSEFLEESVENAMSAAEILALLTQTVGPDAAGPSPAVTHPLRQGLYVTALPQPSVIVLRFEIDRRTPAQRETIAEVAFPAALGSTFFEFVKAALGSAEAIFAIDQVAQPWELELHAESPSGGTVAIKVAGDATAQFTLAWEIASPPRPLDSFTVPTAFGTSKDGTAHVNVVVNFPTSLEQFAFLSTIYLGGVSQRFQDLPLYPHIWLHLTVSTGATERFVIVHFDGITTEGQRVMVAEAPASTEVGGRFLDETLTRMQEMIAQEAAQPGSSGKWQTEFYYAASTTGVVVVAVTGEQGVFHVAYHRETPTQKVKPPGKGSEN
jgi:hypothetical protein